MGIKKGMFKLFFPHRENNYHAALIHPISLLLLLAMFIGAQASLKLFALSRPGVLGYASEITPDQIIALTNNVRRERNLPPLKTNSLLNKAAQQKAGDMFAFDYWAHQSPSGRQPWSFLKDVGYNYRVAGENLARDFYHSQDVVNAWMASPSHKDNIVNPRYKEIGVAVVNGTLGGLKTTLVVQFFGTPTFVANSKPSVDKQPAVVEAKQDTVAVDYETTTTLAGNDQVASNPVINPLHLTQKMSGFLIGILTMVLLVDGYFVLRNKIYRSTGRTTAHIGFLVFVGVLILLSSKPGLIG